MESGNCQVEQLQVTYHPKGAAASGQTCDIRGCARTFTRIAPGYMNILLYIFQYQV